jgi:phosphatidylinositol glycan class B
MTIAALNFWPWNLTTDTILAEGSDPTIKTEKTDPSAPAKAGTQGVLATPQSIKQ